MKIVNVRIKYGGQVMAYECGDLNPAIGDWVLVRDDDLTYLGQVVTAPVLWNPPAPAAEPDQEDGPAEQGSGEAAEDGAGVPPGGSFHLKGPGRKILRLASATDMGRQAENEVREREAFEYCLSRVNSQGLDMKLVAVEVVFDGSKTIFYYTAEERVDFRLLVKELVSRFRTRIEMRQIGVRHEARMIGGLGNCGRCFCCSGFLAQFAPVSVKMAKEQNVSLSPAKISGVCGRLMCCLAFEHAGQCPKGSDNPNRAPGRGGRPGAGRPNPDTPAEEPCPGKK